MKTPNRKSKITAKAVYDDVNRLQVYIESLKTKLTQKYVTELGKGERAIAALLKSGEADTLSEMKRRELEKMLRSIREITLESHARARDSLLEELDGFAKFSVDRERKVVDGWAQRLGRGPAGAPAADALTYAKSQPLHATGELLEGFLETLSGRAVKRIEGAIRVGASQGKTTGEIVREIMGTAARNRKDGLAFQNRREAEAVVRTAVQHVASTARMSVWEANDDVVQGYMWISTLDGVTTSQCRSLDRQRFKLKKGPLPPLHVNCRSTIIADVGPEFDFLDEGATRSSKDGYVPAKQSFYEWLKTQDREFIKDTLGATRAKLFTDGGLSADEFARLNLGKNFKPLTLEEMRKKDSAAFKRAGI